MVVAKKVLAPRNLLLSMVLWENFAKMSGSQLHMIMDWLKFFILFTSIPFFTELISFFPFSAQK